MAFLRVASGLAAALGRLQARGLSHKDFKPGNILVNAATGEVWLTGFDITSRAPRERGVTLYELLTGALPFTATELLEWRHCHIARPPIRGWCKDEVYRWLESWRPRQQRNPPWR